MVRDGVSVGLATGAYGLSFGALSTAGGLTLAQTCALSLLMFTGGSQFALVGVVAGGGSGVGGAATAILLGVRNAFYGLRLASLLEVRGVRRLVAAQLTIDESSAMAVGQEDDPHTARVAFWATGISVFVFWNAATALGALGAEALSDPAVLGLDAAAPAAFLALLAPRVRGRHPLAVALAAAVVAVLVTPFVPAGVPVLAAAGIAVAFALASPADADTDAALANPADPDAAKATANPADTTSELEPEPEPNTSANGAEGWAPARSEGDEAPITGLNGEAETSEDAVAQARANPADTTSDPGSNTAANGAAAQMPAGSEGDAEATITTRNGEAETPGGAVAEREAGPAGAEPEPSAGPVDAASATEPYGDVDTDRGWAGGGSHVRRQGGGR